MKKALLCLGLVFALSMPAVASMKVTIDITSARNSEIKKEEALAAMGVSENAAEITRDANGKVTRVQVNLGSAKAAAAVSAGNAVSGLHAKSNVAGALTVAAYDGTSLPNLQGWTYNVSIPADVTLVTDLGESS